jgi:hypothetical protein
MAPPPTPTLPSSHPLIAELTSLRQQLAQYQKSGHQSAIQLQGARLESNLAKEECTHLREANDTLRSELQILRYVLNSSSARVNRSGVTNYQNTPPPPYSATNFNSLS